MLDDLWTHRQWVALGAGVVIAWQLAEQLVRRVRLWQARRFKLMHGGKPREMFTSHGDLVERPPRPPIRSLRTRGDDDAA